MRRKATAEEIALPTIEELPASTNQLEHAPRVFQEEFAVMRGIAELMKLADAGDERALHALHGQAKAITTFLNEKHAGFAAAVTEWPVVVPQSKPLRDPVLKRMKEIRIGGVKGGGNGRPNNLSRDSQKGFALEVLELVAFVRAIVRSIPVAALRGSCRESFAQTGVKSCSGMLRKRLAALPEYSPDSRVEWIEVARDLLIANPGLIPKSIDKRTTSETFEADGKGGTRRRLDPSARGLPTVIERALTDALSKVDAVSI